MTRVGNVYGQALYDLAKEEDLSQQVLGQLLCLQESFRQEPDFIRLLSTPAISKEERCQILEECFSGKIQAYVLNFLKILTEKGYMRHFSDCCDTYRGLYNRDNHILCVTAVTAIAMTPAQSARLKDKLAQLTGSTIELHNRIDPACYGGVRLDYDGKSLDDTLAHRLAAVRELLKNTVL